MTLADRLAAHARDLDADGHDGFAVVVVGEHEGAADPHTGYRKESDDHSHATTGAQGGTVAHSALTGLTTGDPHTQYRLEADDHSHASSGAQGGQIAYSALTGPPTIPTAGTTPSTQAFGDSAAGGADTTFSKNDHKHAMPADPVTAHAAAGDPHTGYQKESEKSAASGYASLDGSTKVPIAELPTGTSGTTVALGNAAAGLITTHEAAGDPHTGYRLESADHSHASSGAQGGQVAHSALSGIGATDHHAAPVAGPDANITIDAAGDAGTASTFARSAHGHRLNTYSSNAAAIGTAAAGTSTTAPARGDHVHPTGAGTPSTQAFGDAASTGSGPAAAMTDHKHAMPALADLYSQNAIGTADLAIANTETVVVARTFAANELVAGMVYRFEAFFTKAGTNAASPVIRIRIGTTTLTGTVMGTLTPPTQNVASPGRIEGLLRIVTAGSGGTARGDLLFTLHLGAVTLTTAVGPATATAAVNTTTASQRVELTFISGNAANTYTFRTAVMTRIA